MGFDGMLRYADATWCPTGFRRVGRTPVRGRAAVRARRVAGDRGPGVGYHAHDRLPLVSRLEGPGPGGAASGRAGRPEAPVGGAAAGRGGRRVAPRRARPRLPDRPVDVAPRRHGDRAPDRRPLSPGPRVVPLAAAALVAAAAGATRPRTRRAHDSAVGAAALARGKKNARRQHAWLVFEDESGLSTQPVVRRTWAPGGKPRS